MSWEPGRPPSATANYAFPIPGGEVPADYVTDTMALADAIDSKLNELVGAYVEPEPWRYVGQPGQPAFAGTWGNVPDGVEASFRKYPDGRVLVRGAVGGAAWGTVFTLPVDYRPARPHVYIVAIDRTDSVSQWAVTVQSTGGISPSGNPNPAPALHLNFFFATDL